MPNPSKMIAVEFAANGLKNSIQETRTSGIADNAVTYADGFPQITMTPVSSGGKPPSGKDMNGILAEFSSHIVHLNKGNLYQFSTDFSNKINGYSKGAVLISDNLDALFVSLLNNNKTNFNTTAYSGKWFKLPFSFANNLTTNSVEVALSAAMGKKLQDEKLGNSGAQELDGQLKIIRNGWEKLRFVNSDGSFWRFESAPIGSGENGARFNYVFTGADGNEVGRVAFPRVGDGETAAYQSWVIQKLNEAANGYVALTGSQTVAGSKTFSAKAIFSDGLNFRSAVQNGRGGIGVGETDVWIRNETSNKYLQLKDNGDLTYSSQKIYHEGNKPTWNDVQNKPDVATRGTTLAHYGITDAVNTPDFQWAASKPGTVMYFAGDAPPHGWLVANGAAVSRTSFPDLFAAIGTRYGAGNGSTTFNLPDLRGEFIRGWDMGRNVDTGRVLGSFQGQSTEDHWHGIGNIVGNDDNADFILRGWGSGWNGQSRSVFGEGNRNSMGSISSGNLGTGGAIGHTGETRPRNVALLACIKA